MIIASVIMATYNERIDHIKIAIDSIIDQTFQDYEVIVIVDNPDNTEIIELLKAYSKTENRIKILINEKNMGLAQSLNKGIQESTGKYIVRMDADDISKPTRVEKQVQFMEENPNLDIVCCQRCDIDMDGNEISKGSYYISDPQKVATILRYGSPITHPAIIVKREVYIALGGYRDFAAAQDYDFFLRAIKNGYLIGMMKDVLLKYRQNDKGISRSGKFKQYLYKKYAIELFNNESLSFSLDGVDGYLHRNGFYDERVKESFETGIRRLNEAIRKHNVLGVVKEIFRDKNVRGYFINSIQYKRLLDKENE